MPYPAAIMIAVIFLLFGFEGLVKRSLSPVLQIKSSNLSLCYGNEDKYLLVASSFIDSLC